MLIRDWNRAVFAPDTEAGTAGVDTDAGAPPPGGGTGGVQDDAGGADDGQQQDQQQDQQQQQQEGRGSGRSKLRQQLEGANADAKKRTQQQTARDQQGRFQGQQQDQQQQDQQGQQQQQQTQAPEAWTKEAKAVWGQLPPAVQAAVAKREADMQAGVENLKKGYKELDEAIKPYQEAIAGHKTTPAAAVKQLFDWMMALTNEAAEMKAGRAPSRGVFAALARSYGIDPVRLLAHMVQNPAALQNGQQQQQQQNNGQQQQSQLDPAVKQYIDSIFGVVNQNLTGLSTTVQQQSMAKTNEMLSMWAKDKPYFNDVRVAMARLMTPGVNGEPALVPPREDGNADLDKAYEWACQITPGVQTQIKAAADAAAAKEKADKEAAEKAAQKQKLEAARKASGSIPISAPGVPGDPLKQSAKRKQTVRDSINAAVKEVNERA